MAEEIKNNAPETEAPVKAEKEDKKKASKSDKPGLGSRIKSFFKSYKSEMKKIVWFGKKQTIKSSALVIVCLVIVSAIVSLLDIGIHRLIMWIGTLV